MASKAKDDILNTLINLSFIIAAIVVGLYILFKLMAPSKNKEIFRCGNCGGAIVGRPKTCRWCHADIDWSGVK